MDDKNYELEYSKNTTDTKEMHLINWKIPRFLTFVRNARKSNGSNRYHYIVVKAPDSCFQMRISFLGMKFELMNIGFMSLSPIDLVLDFEINVKYNNTTDHDLRNKYSALFENMWYECLSMETTTKHVWDDRDLTIKLKISNPNVTKSNENGLAFDLGQLLNDGTNWDATIKSSDGEEFKVHKLILASRCEVLKAHFDHNTKESTSNVLETQWESDVLREVLTFLYTDRAPNFEAIADKLLAAADFYQLNELKNICEGALVKKLDIDNAIDILKLSELYHTNFLKCSTLNYITSGRAKLVTETEGWNKLENYTLLKDLYLFMANDYCDTLQTTHTNLKSQ